MCRGAQWQAPSRRKPSRRSDEVTKSLAKRCQTTWKSTKNTPTFSFCWDCGFTNLINFDPPGRSGRSTCTLQLQAKPLARPLAGDKEPRGNEITGLWLEDLNMNHRRPAFKASCETLWNRKGNVRVRRYECKAPYLPPSLRKRAMCFGYALGVLPFNSTQGCTTSRRDQKYRSWKHGLLYCLRVLVYLFVSFCLILLIVDLCVCCYYVFSSWKWICMISCTLLIICMLICCCWVFVCIYIYIYTYTYTYTHTSLYTYI